MRPCNTSIEDFLKAIIDIKYFELHHDVPKSENKYHGKATKEQFDEFFNKYGAVVFEYPEHIKTLYLIYKFHIHLIYYMEALNNIFVYQSSED